MSEYQQPAQSEALQSPERLPPYEPMLGAQLRMMLGNEHISPVQQLPDQVKPETIPSIADRDYSPFQHASTHSRLQEIKKRIAAKEVSEDFQEQKAAWIRDTTKILSADTHKDKIQKLAPLFANLGIKADNITEDTISQFYKRFFEHDGQPLYQSSEGKSYKNSDLKGFVTAIISTHTRNGTLNYQELKAHLPEYRWFARIFGKEMQDAITQMIDAEAQLLTDKQGFVDRSMAIMGNGKPRAAFENLSLPEKNMLAYIAAHGKIDQQKRPSQNQQSPPQQQPTPAQIRQEKLTSLQENPDEIADKLLDVETGKIKDVNVDLVPSYSASVESVMKMLVNNDPALKEGKTYVLSDVARAMIRKITEQANKTNKKLSFALYGMSFAKEGKQVDFISYVVPTHDYSTATGDDFKPDLDFWDTNADRIAEKTGLKPLFTHFGQREKGQMVSMFYAQPRQQGRDGEYAQPAKKDFDWATQVTERDGEASWGVVTEADGNIYLTSYQSKKEKEPKGVRTLPSLTETGQYINLYPTHFLVQQKNELFEYETDNKGQFKKGKKISDIITESPQKPQEPVVPQSTQAESTTIDEKDLLIPDKTPEDINRRTQELLTHPRSQRQYELPFNNREGAAVFCDTLRKRLATAPETGRTNATRSHNVENIYTDPISKISITAPNREAVSQAWFNAMDFNLWADRNGLPLIYLIKHDISHASLLLKEPYKENNQWKMQIYDPITGEETIQLNPKQDFEDYKRQKLAEFTYDPQKRVYVSNQGFGINEDIIDNHLMKRWIDESRGNRQISLYENTTAARLFGKGQYDMTLPPSEGLPQEIISSKVDRFQFDGKNCVPLTFFAAALRYAAKPGDNEFKKRGRDAFQREFGIRILTHDEIMKEVNRQ